MAVLLCTVLVNANLIYVMWRQGSQRDGSQVELGSPTMDFVVRWVLEAVAYFLIYIVADQVGRRVLRGRFTMAVGLVLFLVSGGFYEYYSFGGAGVGLDGLIFGWGELCSALAVPFAAGAWMLRSRRPEPVRDLISPEVLGNWDAPRGILAFESDGVFTLASADGTSTAGLWEPLPGVRARVVLKVDADTELGHGWQATVLDLEAGPHGAVLHAGAVEYRRREAEAVLERSHGYVGTVEILEA